MHEPKRREFTFECLLVGELSRHCLAAGKPFDATFSRCDIFGYDLVVHVGNTTRFLQLKTKLVGPDQSAEPYQFPVNPLTPAHSAVVVMVICSQDFSVKQLLCKAVPKDRGRRLAIGPTCAVDGVPGLLQQLFGFRPAPLASAAF